MPLNSGSEHFFDQLLTAKKPPREIQAASPISAGKNAMWILTEKVL
jgi:hypothetical protein